jgi:hypothetical protein
MEQTSLYHFLRLDASFRPLARRLKRQTFGLELGEIAALLQEREARHPRAVARVKAPWVAVGRQRKDRAASAVAGVRAR